MADATGFAPLDMVAKYHTLQYWMQQTPPLNATAIRVLAFLIQCQNPKTGRCDPLIHTIASKVHASERMVRRAIDALVKRGAIGKTRKSIRGRNQYRITAKRLPERSSKRTSMTEEADIPVRPERTQSASEKKKEENKKKKGAQEGWVQALVPTVDGIEDNKIPDRALYPKLQQQFEQDVLRLGAKEGVTLIDLMNVPSGELESLFEEAFFDKTKWRGQVIKALKLCLTYRRAGL